MVTGRISLAINVGLDVYAAVLSSSQSSKRAAIVFSSLNRLTCLDNTWIFQRSSREALYSPRRSVAVTCDLVHDPIRPPPSSWRSKDSYLIRRHVPCGNIFLLRVLVEIYLPNLAHMAKGNTCTRTLTIQGASPKSKRTISSFRYSHLPV